MMFILLLAILLLLLAFHAIIRWSRMGRLAGRIDGPSSLPILGNAFPFILLNEVEAWEYVRQMMKDYYPVVKFWSLTYPLILSRDPNDAKILLTDKTNVEKASNYSYFHVWAENGLITSHGKLWQHRRKIMSPVFAPNMMKRYAEIANQQIENIVEQLQRSGNRIQSLKPLMSKIVLIIITSAAMGMEVNTVAEKNKLDEYQRACHDFEKGLAFRLYRPYITGWMMKFIPVGRRQLKGVKILNSIVRRLITNRRKYHKNIGNRIYSVSNEDSPEAATGRAKKVAAIDHLLWAEKQGLIDKKGVQTETDTLILAGYDTTTISIVFTLLLLAENQEAQQLARAEALGVHERCGGEFTLEDLNDLEYIDRCIKESLRLFPSVPVIGRRIREELQLKTHTVPAGADVAVCICDLHRDPRYWTDPDKFMPDRFLLGEERLHPYTYIPFGAGPRVCIGQKFAFIILKTIVAKFLCNFHLEPVTLSSQVRLEGRFTIHPADPVEIKFISLVKD